MTDAITTGDVMHKIQRNEKVISLPPHMSTVPPRPELLKYQACTACFGSVLLYTLFSSMLMSFFHSSC